MAKKIPWYLLRSPEDAKDGVCGKVPYDTRAEAAATMARQKEKKFRGSASRFRGQGRSEGKLNVYTCPLCTKFHVGHTSK